MNAKISVSIVVTVCLWLSVSFTRAQDNSLLSIGTKVGQMYPDFLLPKLDGTKGRLSDYRGRKVLLIHFASW